MSSDDLQRGALAIVLAAAGASCCCIASVHLLPQCSWQRCAWLLSGHTARSGVGDGDDEPSDAAAATVTVALVQAASEMGAVSANISRLEKAIRQAAADHGAKIMVLPETAVTGYLSQDLAINWHVPGRPLDRRYDMTRSMDPHKFAEQQNGPSVRHFAELARELGVYITVPFIETSAEGNNEEGPVLYNAVSLVGPESDKAVAHYRKNCPWPDPEKYVHFHTHPTSPRPCFSSPIFPTHAEFSHVVMRTGLGRQWAMAFHLQSTKRRGGRWGSVSASIFTPFWRSTTTSSCGHCSIQ